MSKPTTNPKSVAAYKKQSERQRQETERLIGFEQEEEQQGIALAALMRDPFAEVADLAAKTGLREGVIRGLKTALSTQLQAPTAALRRITNASLLDKIDDRLDRAVDGIDEMALARAPLRDKVYAADRLFNMRQLLKGEPTQIVSSDERKALNDLIPALIRSAQRRGVIIDGIGRTLEAPQRGVPDSRLIVDGEIIEPSAGPDAAQPGGGVDVEPSSAVPAATGQTIPNESVLDGRASDVVPVSTETATHD